MATITSAQSGLASDTSTWVGGVVPVVGDKAIIAAGHTVTLSATHHWGDDTSTGITVNGTLRASRTVSSQLTCRGDLYINHGGTLDYGTEADPVPASVTATIIVNDSAVMAHNKWGIRTEHGAGAGFAGFRLWGAYKTPDTTLTAPVGAADTVIPVADATGWLVGDLLGFAPAVGTAVVYRAITAVASSGGTAANVTISGSLGRSGVVGNGILNTSRNVKVTGVLAATWRSHVSLRVIGAAVDRIELGPATVALGGNVSNSWQLSGLSIYYEASLGTRAVKKIDGLVISSLVSVVGSTETHVNSSRNGLTFFNMQAAPVYVEAVYVAMPTVSGQGLQVYSGSSVEFGPKCIVLGGTYAFSSQYSQGAVAARYSGRVWGANVVVFGVAISIFFDGAVIGGHGSMSGVSAAGTLGFSNCRLGVESDGEAANTANSYVFSSTATLAPTVVRNPTVGARFGVSRASSNLAAAHSTHTLTILQLNGDPAANQRYSPGGRVHRDATRTRRSTGSICLASWYAANVLSMPLTAKVPAGETLRIKGSVWIEAAYLPGDAPGISLSATGLTTVNWSAPAVADAWQEFDLSITNTNAYPTDVAITLTARSNANTETARVWFDGLFADPWSGSVRHHGFQWLAQTALAADSRITLTEAAALALPVAVDHTAQTITVTGALTARQVFEACMADLAQTVNQGRLVHLTSATGDSFETSYTVATSGAGVIAGAYVDSAGRHVTISAPALIAGSRVQVYDITTSTELFNGVLAAQGLLLPVTWSADHTLRLRAEHADMLALETVAVLSSAGATVLDVQQADTVYLTNAIDGSTCTEFVADGANVQVDISDPDGVTSVQRLYAWAQWYQATAAGIASGFFGAVEALDSASYLIDQAKADIKLDNVGAMPVRVVGGYLSRRDGSTVIAATSGSIQMDPGKAYAAGVDGLARESTVQAVLAVSLG